MALVGSGFGTFYSRSARQFYMGRRNLYQQRKGAISDDYKAVRERRSDSMRGVIQQVRYDPFYFQFYLDESQKIYPLYTGQADEPFASYVSLLGETGILGTLFYLGIYFVTGRRLLRLFKESEHDPTAQRLTACALGFLVYTLVNCIFNNWLETTRMTSILWSIMGISLMHPKVVPVERLA
jgi:hypothetical protein